MVKSVVIDLDGVIRHRRNDKLEALEQRCKLPSGTLMSICYDRENAVQAYSGKITYDDWTQRIHAAIDKRFGCIIADYTIDAFKAPEYKIDYDLITQIRMLFPESRLVLAANSTSRLPLELKEANLHQRFDHVFNSSAMGVIKPQRGFFYGMLITLGLSTRDIVYIDDSLKNVQAAKASGITAYHFENRTRLVSQLTDFALQTSMLA